MTDQENAAIHRVVCERCEMRTGKMPEHLARKGRRAHEESTGHITEVVVDEVR